jgi:hypothetical protein
MLTLLTLTAALAAPGPTPGEVRAVRDVVHVQVEPGYAWTWTAAPRTVTELTAFVVDVDPTLVVPSQVSQRALYVGATPAERVNVGLGCSCLIALVPGRVDLSTTPVYFGTDTLPERVDDAHGAAELAAAVAAGVKPFAATEVLAATAPDAVATSAHAVYAVLMADLVQRWAPQEAALAAGWQVPLLTPR